MPPRKKPVIPKDKVPTICLICLHTEKKVVRLHEDLAEFYEDFCDYSCKQRTKTACSECHDTINKCFYFHKQCKVANKLLNEWCENQARENITNLHKKLANHNFDESDDDIDLSSDSDGLITDEDEKIKIEVVPDIRQDQLTDSVGDNIQIKLEPIDGEGNEEIIIYEGIRDFGDNSAGRVVKDDSDSPVNNSPVNNSPVTNSPVSDDDDSDNDSKMDKFLKGVKTKQTQSKPKETTKKKVRVKKIINNIKEYEKVFDIQLFSNYDEAKAEFAQRQHSDYYINAKYKCKLCFTVYRNERCVDYHMKWHDPKNGTHECDICFMRFNTAKKRYTHKARCHYGRFSCRMCPMVTYYTTAMKYHYGKHTNVLYRCEKCKKCFNHKSSYCSHQRICRAPTHVCGICTRTFVSQSGLKIHMTLRHGQNVSIDKDGAKCEECGVTFVNVETLNLHIWRTHKNTSAASSGCDEQSSSNIMKQQSDAQTDRDPNIIVCKVCNKEGNNNKWLYHHMKHEHPEVPYEPRNHWLEKKHLCSHCGKGYRSTVDLADHENIHTGARPYPCDKCPSKFRSERKLKIHSKIHEPPSLACEQCGKKFVSYSNLYNHMRSHIGDRRFKCKICGKGFLHASALQEHIRGVHLQIRRQKVNRPK